MGVINSCIRSLVLFGALGCLCKGTEVASSVDVDTRPCIDRFSGPFLVVSRRHPLLKVVRKVPRDLSFLVLSSLRTIDS